MTPIFPDGNLSPGENTIPHLDGLESPFEYCSCALRRIGNFSRLKIPINGTDSRFRSNSLQILCMYLDKCVVDFKPVVQMRKCYYLIYFVNK